MPSCFILFHFPWCHTKRHDNVTFLHYYSYHFNLLHITSYYFITTYPHIISYYFILLHITCGSEASTRDRRDEACTMSHFSRTNLAHRPLCNRTFPVCEYINICIHIYNYIHIILIYICIHIYIYIYHMYVYSHNRTFTVRVDMYTCM